MRREDDATMIFEDIKETWNYIKKGHPSGFIYEHVHGKGEVSSERSPTYLNVQAK